MIRLNVFFAARQSPHAVIDRLLRTERALLAVRRSTWSAVNTFLRTTVVANFLDQISNRSNTYETVLWKKKRARGFTPEQRGQSSGEVDFAKAAFADKYGRMTGFFLDKLKTAPLGSFKFMVRNVERSHNTNALNWGINLPDFFKGYPGWILDGALMSVNGGPGLLSINRGDLETVRNILYYDFFLYAVALGRRRAGGA